MTTVAEVLERLAKAREQSHFNRMMRAYMNNSRSDEMMRSMHNLERIVQMTKKRRRF